MNQENKITHHYRKNILIFIILFPAMVLSMAILFACSNNLPKIGAAMLFTGNFDNGSMSQWPMCQTAYYNNPCSGYNNADHNLRAVTNPVRQGSHSMRVELRDGDTPSWSQGTERAQVKLTGGQEPINSERWYSLSVMFANGYPLAEGEWPWQLFTQWHDPGNGSPMITVLVYKRAGVKYMAMKYTPYDSVYTNVNVIWEYPIDYDKWYDLKFHFVWSPNPNTGKIEIKVNNQPTTFKASPYLASSSCTGKTICTTPTMFNGSGDTYKYWVNGPYRDADINGTAVIYYDNAYVASSETDLPALPDNNPPSPPSTSNPTPTPSPTPAPTPSIPTSVNNNSSASTVSNAQKVGNNGELKADFDGDGKDDIAIDKNGDNKIDSDEIVNSDVGNDGNYSIPSDNKPKGGSYIDLGIGPLPETKVSKPIFIAFSTAQALSIISTVVLFVIRRYY